MTKTSFASLGVLSCLLFPQGSAIRSAAQDDPLHLRVNVVLVQLNVAVTDAKGNYVTGLRPEDFAVIEDKIPQKVSTFEESSESGHSPMEVVRKGQDGAPADPDPASLAGSASGITISHMAEANVFILFDTSNYMYRSFVFAQDAIADFIRSMDEESKVAFYSYSRDLLRETSLTSDHFRIVNGVRSTVAGDDAAL